MCTAFSHTAGDHYFGRNLDLDYHYNEEVTITPRNFQLNYRHTQQPEKHYAMIGIATVMDGYPLYYDTVNEMGLSMAGLNFPGNAVYQPIDHTKTNIASFELIPWVLSQCRNIREAKSVIKKINLCDTAFGNDLPPTPLHWIISDHQETITVEPTSKGIEITDNPIGVLTNNPPFFYHLYNISNYMNLGPSRPCNHFSRKQDLKAYSLGMGAIGLPGDFSSASRFVRCSFIKENSAWGEAEEDHVTQTFHILDGVSQFDGCVKTDVGYEKTLYSICYNASKGILYYTTYGNRQITAVDLRKEDLNGAALGTYPLITGQSIKAQN